VRDGGRREAVIEFAGVKPLKVQWREAGERDAPEVRDDVKPRVTLVADPGRVPDLVSNRGEEPL
jgi:hypothetical protein